MTDREKNELLESISLKLQHGISPEELKSKTESTEVRAMIDAENSRLEKIYADGEKGFWEAFNSYR